MMNCREATRLMSDARERPLTVSEKLALRVHTALCGACRNFDRQIDIMGKLGRTFARGDRPDSRPTEEKDPNDHPSQS